MSNENPPPNAVPAAMFAMLERWAVELGVDWTRVLADAEVDSRTSIWRMKQGTASLGSARKIEAVLKGIEEDSKVTTNVGELMQLVEEWAAIGRDLAIYDPAKFRELIGRTKIVRDGAKAAKELETITNPDR